jgi:hypothetical protein
VAYKYRRNTVVKKRGELLAVGPKYGHRVQVVPVEPNGDSFAQVGAAYTLLTDELEAGAELFADYIFEKIRPPQV